MISLDLHKYDNIKETYLRKVYDMLENMSFHSAAFHVTREPLVIRELVYMLYVFGLMPCLIDASSDRMHLLARHKNDVDAFCDEELMTAVQALVHADVSTLRAASEELRTRKGGKFHNELHEYQTLRRKRGRQTPAEAAREKALAQDYEFLVYFGDRSYENMRRQKVNLSAKDSVNLPELMVEALGIRTCPYCNRGFIGLTRGLLMGVQLDHFLSRSKFPFFAVSLYNLVPSCGVCNNLKRDEISDMISPFEADADFEHAVHFTYEIPKAGGAGAAARQLGIEICETDPVRRRRYQENIERLRLGDVYHFQEAEAKRFYEKMLAYPKSRLLEIERHVNTNAPSDPVTAKELEELLFYEYFTEPGDDARMPMAKFYRDLYYDLRGWERKKAAREPDPSGC